MSIESTFGTVYIGFVLGVICYGFIFFQTYVYFSRFPKDAALIRFTVIALCAIDTGSSALLSHAAHHYLVRMFSSGNALTEVTRSLCGEIGLMAIAIMIVQSFYSFRLWKADKKIMAAVILAFNCIGFACNIVMTVLTSMNPTFTHFDESSVKIVVIVAQAAVLTAALIAFVVLDILGQDGTRLGAHRRTMTLVIMLDVLTLVFQVAYLVVFAISSNKLYWVTIHLLCSKLFVNSHLSMLNSRQISHGHGVETTASNTKPSPTPVRFNVAATQSPLNIEVSRTVVQDNDRKNRYTDEDENSLHDMTKTNFV